MARVTVLGGCGAMVLAPWLNGERTPVDSTTLRGGLYNLSLATTLQDVELYRRNKGLMARLNRTGSGT